jgi:phosphoribosylformylglycinamidine synthase
MGVVDDIERCVTMDAKSPGSLLIIVGQTDGRMGGSHYQMLFDGVPDASLPEVDLAAGPRAAAAVAKAIGQGLVRSAHDCSEGGLLVAAAEMAFAGDVGVRLDLAMLPTADRDISAAAACFAETPSRYLLEIARNDLDAVDAALRGVPYAIVGEFDDSQRFVVNGADVDVRIDALRSAWLGTLDW